MNNLFCSVKIGLRDQIVSTKLKIGKQCQKNYLSAKLRVLKYLEKTFLLYATTKFVNFTKSSLIKVDLATLKPDIKSIQFQTHDSPALRKFYQKSWLNCVTAAVQLFQLLALSSTTFGGIKPHPPHIMILGWFNCLGLVGASIITQSCRSNGPALKMYLNSLIKFQNKYRTKIKSSTESKSSNGSIMERLNFLLVPMLLISSVVIPLVLVLGFHWTHPCKPSLVGFFILAECHQSCTISTQNWEIVLNIFIKASVFLWNMWTWMFGFQSSVYLVISVSIIGSMMCKECLQIFLNRLKCRRDIYTDGLLYREIQIMNVISNSVQQRFLGITMTNFTIGLAMLFNLLVGFVNRTCEETNFIMIIGFALLAVDCILGLLVLLAGMAVVYVESKRKLDECKRVTELYKVTSCRTWAKRYWRSCYILKVKFGDGNFLEKLTPLKCLDVAFNLTVQFLLLSRNK